MPATRRRALLASLGAVAVGSVAGCSLVTSGRPPAGSLRFENDHGLPHAVTMRVTGVGSEPGDGPGTVAGDATVPPAQRRMAASTTVTPGETETYEQAFTEPVWYAVQFTVDGREPENDTGLTAFHPTPPGADSGRFLAGRVRESGKFGWVIGSTENFGPFQG